MPSDIGEEVVKFLWETAKDKNVPFKERLRALKALGNFLYGPDKPVDDPVDDSSST